jgi:Excalibur calcium-binding domain/Protein of unknown function (DUF1524)
VHLRWMVLGTSVALSLGACGATTTSTTGATHTRPADTVRTATTRTVRRTARPGSALTGLERLPVKGRAPKTGYSRAQFGDDWISVRGCDTRDLMLRRDLREKTYADTSRCEVDSGTLADPYTARSIAFVRGRGDDVDLDHVVALGDAWQKGAQRWSPGRRVAFANDPLNLLSVDASANRQKGDGDAATWLPSNKAFRCDYVARQIAVKRRYGAWVTGAERDAMRRILTRCPAERLPVAGRLRIPALTSPPASPSGAPGYANCAAARAAGAAPLRRGTPAYRANRDLDGDGDGVACE